MVLTGAPPVPRVLVVGTGSIGRRHIANLQSLRPGVHWGLLRDGGRRDDFSDSLGAEVFGSLECAMAWKPDLAVVATPSDRHIETVPSLLDAGIGCYIEKPIVTIERDAERLLHMMRRPMPPTQVGCVLRFLPSLRSAKSWIAEGRLGRIVRASFEVGQWLPDWRPTQDYRSSYSASWKRGGGVVLDLVHELDLACWFFGDVSFLGAWGGKLSGLEIDAEDVALVALRSPCGAPLSVQMDYVSRQPVRRIHVVGDEGSLCWDLPSRRCTLSRAGEAPVEAHGFDTASAYIESMDELLRAIEHGSPTSLPLESGLQATRLAIIANEAIRGRQDQ